MRTPTRDRCAFLSAAVLLALVVAPACGGAPPPASPAEVVVPPPAEPAVLEAPLRFVPADTVVLVRADVTRVGQVPPLVEFAGVQPELLRSIATLHVAMDAGFNNRGMSLGLVSGPSLTFEEVAGLFERFFGAATLAETEGRPPAITAEGFAMLGVEAGTFAFGPEEAVGRAIDAPPISPLAHRRDFARAIELGSASTLSLAFRQDASVVAFGGDVVPAEVMGFLRAHMSAAAATFDVQGDEWRLGLVAIMDEPTSATRARDWVLRIRDSYVAVLRGITDETGESTAPFDRLGDAEVRVEGREVHVSLALREAEAAAAFGAPYSLKSAAMLMFVNALQTAEF